MDDLLDDDEDYEEEEPERCGCRCGCPRSRLPFHQFCGMCSECCFNPPPAEEP